MYNQELYIPRIARIKAIKQLSVDTRLFKVSFLRKNSRLCAEHQFLPGQFAQVSIFDVGEVPVSIASSPEDKGILELSVRKVGRVTSGLHKLGVKDEIGIRGPYGNHFPVQKMKGRRFLFVGGGCGLAPLRSLIKYILRQPKKYPQPTLLYGARTRDDILFKHELSSFKKLKQVDVRLSVDCGPADPGCSAGLVTSLLKQFRSLRDSVAFICGPPLMLRFVIGELIRLKVKEKNIILSLERYMQCGVGKCGHCYLKDKYVCTDGPIFSYQQLKDLGVEF